MELFIKSTHIVEQSYNDVYEDIGRGRRAGMFYIMFNEGFSIGQFNQHRYLGPNYAPAKDSSVLRIALLGDSYVEGFQVFDRHHFRAILEKQLSEKLKHKVEILNFGRSGFDIGDMYAYNQTFVKEFSPDYSLFFVSNADFYPQFTDPLRLKVRVDNDSLMVEKGYPESYIQLYDKTKIFIQHSNILNMLNNDKKTIKSQGFLPLMLEKFYPFGQEEIDSSHYIFNTQIPDITKKIFESLDVCKTIVVNRDAIPLQVQKMALVENNQLLFINLTDTLNVLIENGIDPHYWKATNKHGHWNHEAHKAVGAFLAEKLSAIIENKEN